MLDCELLFPWKKVVQRKMISSYASTEQSDGVEREKPQFSREPPMDCRRGKAFNNL